MINVDLEKCKGCRICEKNCPIGAVHVVDKKARVDNSCVQCGVCTKVCPFGAITRGEGNLEGSVMCTNCPVRCHIPEGSTGACKRFTNVNGVLERNRPLELDPKPHLQADPVIARRPLITAVGAGSHYPCSTPAPHIVTDKIDGVDVVTVVTEAPLSYSGCTVKIDTDANIGEEGDLVTREGKVIGMMNTEEFGAKMITIGGANKLTGDGGFVTARTITELCNGEAVDLVIGKKHKVRVQRGMPPVINGVAEKKMRLGCGSGAVGLFAAMMKECVDECVVIDHHIIGVASEHPAGAAVGFTWRGLSINATKSSPGRYFSKHGSGIGGTALEHCRDVISGVDMSVAWPGMQILTVTALGDIYEMFEVQADGSLKDIPMTENALRLVHSMADNCEDSRCSVLYIGGCGGSARGGVCHQPLALSHAVHNRKAVLTIGGAPINLMPGGGINFTVDTAEVLDRAFTWVPTPATVAPIEYTMKKDDYEAIGGHMSEIKSVEPLREKYRKEV